MYKKLGFSGDARWYETAASALGFETDRRKHFLDLLNEPSLSQHRYFAGSSVGVVSRGAYAMPLASRLPASHEYVKLAQAEVSRLARSRKPEDKLEAIRRAGFLGPYSVPAIFPALTRSRSWEHPFAAGAFFGRLKLADGVPNPWAPLLRERLKGTAYENF